MKLFGSNSKKRGAHEKGRTRSPAESMEEAVRNEAYDRREDPAGREPEVKESKKETGVRKKTDAKKESEVRTGSRTVSEPVVIRRAPTEPAVKEPAVRQMPAANAEKAEKPKRTEQDVKPQKKKKSRFGLFFALYVILLVAAAGAGLTYLWHFMDCYERSRPYKPMDAYMESMNPDAWRSSLEGMGVGGAYLNSLDFENVSYYKLLGEYTDAVPVYGIRFGDKKLMRVELAQSEELDFGFFGWSVKNRSLFPSHLSIFAPPDAVIRADGRVIGAEYLVKKNAQPLTLGSFEEGRDDIPGLSQYEVNDLFDGNGITVTDSEGNELPLGYSTETAFYYAPMMSSYTIEAPATAVVSVNGMILNENNCEMTETVNTDFTGEKVEEYLPFIPATRVYVVPDLVARPIVDAKESGGAPLTLVEDGNSFVYDWKKDEPISPEREKLVLGAFEAYVNYAGNKNGDISGNLSRLRAYLLKGSEADERALLAKGSLRWVSGGRDKYLKDRSIGEYVEYNSDMFACRVDYKMEKKGVAEENSYLFVFVWKNNSYKVVRILNTTSFLSNPE